MRIGIDINGVLRDTFSKAEQLYQKHYIDEYESDNVSSYDSDTDTFVEEIVEEEFKYELDLPVTNFDELGKHFKFRREEDLFDFFYVDFPMQIFGHSSSINPSTFNYLNELYEELRDNHEVLIVSDEITKSKPSTLFFLSKYGCLVEKIKFYSNITLDTMWDEIDILVTSNPNHIISPPKNKIVVKCETTYNKNIEAEHTIKNIGEFKELYEQLNLK